MTREWDDACPSSFSRLIASCNSRYAINLLTTTNDAHNHFDVFPFFSSFFLFSSPDERCTSRADKMKATIQVHPKHINFDYEVTDNVAQALELKLANGMVKPCTIDNMSFWFLQNIRYAHTRCGSQFIGLFISIQSWPTNWTRIDFVSFFVCSVA